MTVDDPASQQQQRMKRAKDDSPENAQNHNTQGQMDVEYSAIIAQQQSPATPSKRRRTTNQIELIPIELPTKPIVSSLPFVPRTPCKPRYAAALAPKPDPPGTGPFKQTEKNLWEFNQTLQSLSVKLNLDGDSQNLISCLLHKCLESAEGLGIDCTRPFMQPSALLAVLIWFVDRLVAQNSMGSGISLSQLLITTNITTTNFFINAKHWLDITGNSGGLILKPNEAEYLANQIREIETENETIFDAYQHMKWLFSALMSPNDLNYVLDIMGFTWLLYLNSKEILIPPPQQLNRRTSRTIMLCCVKFLVTQIPITSLSNMADVLFKFDLPAVNLPTAALQQPWIVNFAKDVFELIYKRFELQPSEIGNDESIFFRYLKLTYIESKEWAYDTIVDNPYSGISLIKGAFDSDDRRVLHFNTESQRRRYDKFIANKSGRIDGRLFLTKKTNAIVTPRKILSTPKSAIKTPAVRNLKAELVRASSLDSSMPSTPLTAKNMACRKSGGAVIEDDQHTGDRLKAYLASQAEGPSQFLADYFANRCNPNPQAVIMDRVRKAINQFCALDSQCEGIWRLASKFYFKALELIIRGAEILSDKPVDLSKKMGDAKFHRSLLCCAYEMNRYCFKVTSINFEFIMKYLEVKPFDFIIIAEMSIKYFGLLLNWNLVKRIKELEERMLESEIWKTIHPLYSQMDQESELCERNTDYQPSPRKALTHVTSRDSFFKGGSTEDDDEDIKDYGAVSMRTSVTDLELVFRKIYRLVHLRLHNLCADCLVPEEVEGKVWDLMADILVNEHKNKLIFTRHIDQIILCAIYTICRTFNLEVGFKELVGSYRKQPQVGVLADAITRNIPIANGKRGDIIDFNNTVFVPVVKNKIYPIIQSNPSDDRVVVPTMKPILKPLPFTELMSPNRRRPVVPGAVDMTPRTSKLICTGSAIKPLNASRPLIKSARKLFFPSHTASPVMQRSNPQLPPPIPPPQQQQQQQQSAILPSSIAPSEPIQDCSMKENH